MNPRTSPLPRAVVAVTLAVIVLGLMGLRTDSQAEAATTGPPVVVVMLENQEEFKLNATNAPYLMSLKAQGRYFSKYHGVMHPSFANYLAVSGGSTFGFTSGSITAGMIPGTSLWDQLTAAGVSWGIYQEHMPTPCFAKATKLVTSPTKDKYAIGHNPGVVYANVFTSAECQQVLPLTQMPSTLPAMSFVTPSYCNDMHGVANLTFPADCQKKTQALITRSDTWLASHVEDWRAAGAIVIVTFDEGTTKQGTGGHVYTVAVGPGIAPSVDATTYNHYSLLAGLEDRFGVARLRNAVGAAPMPID